VLVSAAKMRAQIVPQPFLPPQPGTADRTSAMNSCSPMAASLPGSAPHRDVTTCKAASQVRDCSGWAHVSVTTGQATDRKSRIRFTALLLTAANIRKIRAWRALTPRDKTRITQRARRRRTSLRDYLPDG